MPRTLLIGGPGNISTSAVSELLANNHTVAIFTLAESPSLGFERKGVTFHRGTRDNPAELDAAVCAFKPDCVIDFVCFTPKQAEAAAKIARNRCGHYVFVSTVDIYGYPLSRVPMRESDPFNAPFGEYATNKRLCENVFQSYRKKKNLPLTVVRPAYSFGNSFVLSYLDYGGGKHLVPRIREGKPLPVPGDGTTLMHVSASYNTGRQIATVAMSGKTIGKSYTVGHEMWTTVDGYYRMMGRALDREPVLVHIPTDLLFSLNMNEIRYSPLGILCRHNLAFSPENFQKDFPAFRWEMSLERWFKKYIAYHDKKGGFPSTRRKTLEDRVVAAYQKATKRFSL